MAYYIGEYDLNIDFLSVISQNSFTRFLSYTRMYGTLKEFK